jgi:hypothetical protein
LNRKGTCRSALQSKTGQLETSGVGGEPDHPAVCEEQKGLMGRQHRAHRPGNVRLSEAQLI